MLSWLKKNFEQVEEANWYYESRADAKIYESSCDHITEQLREQKRAFLQRKVGELGFKQERDYDGRPVLKNNVPIKRSMAFREVENLVNRLTKPKNLQNTVSKGKKNG